MALGQALTLSLSLAVAPVLAQAVALSLVLALALAMALRGLQNKVINKHDAVRTQRPVRRNRVMRGSNWASVFTAALPSRHPSGTLWRPGEETCPRLPEYNEATLFLVTSKS